MSPFYRESVSGVAGDHLLRGRAVRPGAAPLASDFEGMAMSWWRGTDGKVQDFDDTGPVDEDVLPAKRQLRPVIGGVRHRAHVRGLPAKGEVIRMACGFLWTVNRRKKSPHLYDCHACEEVHAESRL
ncbi:hypothetical protein [Amycolatopsis sp. CA-230715]|uniref:hypothetical protein n=1 Tax=Amycolatopsis sp. CA-230715 TaxID=2745196 RepID=UPI001C02F1DC|nr:hypothetical protein [Amycolatopsis sp. CA-230715]